MNHYNDAGTVRLRSFHEYGAVNNVITLSSTAIEAGKWYHVALIRDASAKTNTFIINGVIDGPHSYNYNPDGGTSAYVLHGRSFDPDWAFDGTLDEVAIYNVALDTADIQRHYNLAHNPLTSPNGSGNLTNDGTRLYHWDALNRLVEVRRKSDDEIIGIYSYDAMGRRIRKVIPEISANVGGLSGTISAGTIDYVYSGWQCVEERNDSNVTQKQYVWGIYIDELVQMYVEPVLPEDNEYFYPLQDMLYRTIALTDTNANIVEAYDYDAYGNTIIYNAMGTTGATNNEKWFAPDATTTSTPTCPYLFTGRRYDAETEIYHYRRRYYTPSLAVFTSRDPLNFVDGLALYKYARENPILWADAYGNQAKGSSTAFTTETPFMEQLMDLFRKCTKAATFLLIFEAELKKAKINLVIARAAPEKPRRGFTTYSFRLGEYRAATGPRSIADYTDMIVVNVRYKHHKEGSPPPTGTLSKCEAVQVLAFELQNARSWRSVFTMQHQAYIGDFEKLADRRWETIRAMGDVDPGDPTNFVVPSDIYMERGEGIEYESLLAAYDLYKSCAKDWGCTECAYEGSSINQAKLLSSKHFSKGLGTFTRGFTGTGMEQSGRRSQERTREGGN
jgi:RHS repeat-associated protein